MSKLLNSCKLLGCDRGTPVLETIAKFKDLTKNVKPDTQAFKRFQDARNDVIQAHLEKELTENGKFIIPPIPNACTECKGTGRKYKLQYKPVTIKCANCNNGINIHLCSYCDKDPNCPYCKGEGKYEVKCTTCKGKGEIKKFFKTGKFHEAHNCLQCGGSGEQSKKKQPKKETKLHNPVLTQRIMINE